MGFLDTLKNLSHSLAWTVFNPERVQRIAERFREAGVGAEIEWMPGSDPGELPRSGSRICVGKVRLDAAPIGRFEVHVISSNNRSRGRIMPFEHHYVVDLPDSRGRGRVKADRVPRHRYWLFGRIVGYRWKGGDLAERLEAEMRVTRLLDEAGVGELMVEADREEGTLWLVQRLAGRMVGGASVLGMLGGGAVPTLIVADELPTRERVVALVELAKATVQQLKRVG